MAKEPQHLSIKTKITALLHRLIPQENDKLYHLLFQKYHEADIADAVEELSSDNQNKFFLKLNPESAAEVLEQMDTEHQLHLLRQFKTDLSAQFIEEMDPDDAADLLEELLISDEKIAEDIIDALPDKEASDIKELLSYKEDSAGAIMTTKFLSMPENQTVAQALGLIKQQNPPDSEVSFYIFIVDKNNTLIGYTTLRTLILSDQKTLVQDIRNDYPISVPVDLDQEEVAKLIRKYDLIAIPVVNHHDHLVGLITVDDVVDVVVEEATEDLYKLSGTSDLQEEKLLHGRFKEVIMSRLPWLILTIFGGIVASYIIRYYSTFFSPKLFSLAFSLSIIPLLMGLGGNVGNQSATIMVRGLATGHIAADSAAKYVFREIMIGFIIALIVSLLVLVITTLTKQPISFSFIVFISLLINISCAALIGASLPIIFQRFNIDPAVASAPFISTTLDIIGQLIYFSVTLYIIMILT